MSQNSRQLDYQLSQQRKARVAAVKLLGMTSVEFASHHTGRSAQAKRERQLAATENISKLISNNQSEPANNRA